MQQGATAGINENYSQAKRTAAQKLGPREMEMKIQFLKDVPYDVTVEVAIT